MISPRMILSTAATLALLVPAMTPTASLAQQHQGRGAVAAGGGAHVGGGGAHVGGGGAHMGGGGAHMGGGAQFGGGGGARMGEGATMGGGARVGGAAPQQFNAGAGGAGPRVAAGAAGPRVAAGASTTQFNGGQRFNGGERFNGGQRFSGGERFNGGDRGYRRGGGGWIPGAVAGAAVGGAIASGAWGYNDYYGPSYAYYNGPEYYDDQYYDGGAVAVESDVGGDSAGYCAQRYRSYDPASGTYLGFDGLRHPCP